MALAGVEGFFLRWNDSVCRVSVVVRPACPSQETPFLAHSYTPPSAAGCPG